jgi:hypothetical protein
VQVASRQKVSGATGNLCNLIPISCVDQRFRRNPAAPHTARIGQGEIGFCIFRCHSACGAKGDLRQRSGHGSKGRCAASGFGGEELLKNKTLLQEPHGFRCGGRSGQKRQVILSRSFNQTMRRAGRDAKGGPSGFCIPDLRGGHLWASALRLSASRPHAIGH